MSLRRVGNNFFLLGSSYGHELPLRGNNCPPSNSKPLAQCMHHPTLFNIRHCVGAKFQNCSTSLLKDIVDCLVVDMIYCLKLIIRYFSRETIFSRLPVIGSSKLALLT